MADESGSGEKSSLEGNPFVALFPSMTQAMQYASQVKTSEMVNETLKSSQIETSQDNSETERALDVKRIVNDLLERIFLITLQKCKFTAKLIIDH